VAFAPMRAEWGAVRWLGAYIARHVRASAIAFSYRRDESDVAVSWSAHKCQVSSSHISQLRAGRVKRDPVKNESCSWFGPALSLPPLACLNMRKGRSRHRPLVPVPEPEIARQGLSVSVPPARAGPGYGRIDGHPGWGFGSGGGGNAIWRTQVFRAILERRSVLESERGAPARVLQVLVRRDGATFCLV
jgi:hypothetical protein